MGDRIHPRRFHRCCLCLQSPHPLRPAVEGGFTLDDFTYNEQAGTLTCPNQVTRQLSKTRTATFGRICGGCPLRKRCTTSAKGRVVTLTEFEQVRRDHRARAKEPDFQQVYRAKRPLVERSIAWLTRGNPAAPLPRGGQEQRVAPPPSGRVEPPSASHFGTHLDERDLGVGLTRPDQPRLCCLARSRRPGWSQAGGTTPLSHSRVLTQHMPLDGLGGVPPAPKRQPRPSHAVVQQAPRAGRAV